MNNQNHISEELLWQYVDKLLSNQERLEIDTHLQNCDACSLELEEIQSFNTEVSDVVIQEPSMRFSKNVMEMIEEEVASIEYLPLLSSLWFKLLGGGFAAFIFAVISFGFTGQKTDIVWMDSMNSNLGVLFSSFSNLVSSGISVIVILIAFWMLFIVDKFYLSKRFG
jgi:hypothetical protein